MRVAKNLFGSCSEQSSAVVNISTLVFAIRASCNQSNIQCLAMEDTNARKNVNVFELDRNASNQDYLDKLAELNIFLNGKTLTNFFHFLFLFLERELENYKAAFREHDEDGSGKLN